MIKHQSRLQKVNNKQYINKTWKSASEYEVGDLIVVQNFDTIARII